MFGCIAHTHPFKKTNHKANTVHLHRWEWSQIFFEGTLYWKPGEAKETALMCPTSIKYFLTRPLRSQKDTEGESRLIHPMNLIHYRPGTFLGDQPCPGKHQTQLCSSETKIPGSSTVRSGESVGSCTWQPFWIQKSPLSFPGLLSPRCINFL